jgi:type IV fimbrial biogenesis protein FimT
MHVQGSSNCGFTLIELMLVVAVLAITMLVAVPSMQRTIHSSQLRTETSRLLSAINLARSEAIASNTIVSLCPSSYVSDGVASCSRNYADGWLVFTNSNRDREVDEGVDKIVKVFEGLPLGYSLTNKAASRNAFELISYRPDGSSRRNMTLLLCSPHSWSIPSWSIVMNIVGRPRVARAWGQCP